MPYKKKRDTKEYSQWWERTEGALCRRKKYNATPERRKDLVNRVIVYRDACKFSENKSKRYTREEEEFLLSSNKTVTEISDIMGRSVCSVIAKRVKLRDRGLSG